MTLRIKSLLLGLLCVVLWLPGGAARAQTLIIDDQFQRANTSSGTIGSPDSYTPPGTNGAWTVGNGLGSPTLQIVSHQVVVGSTGNNLLNQMLRPSAEASLNGAILVDVSPPSSGTVVYTLYCRQVQASNGLMAIFSVTANSCQTYFQWNNGGGTAGLTGGGTVTTLTAGARIYLRLDCAGGDGVVPTMTATVIDKTSGSQLSQYTCNASGANASTTHAGSFGYGAIGGQTAVLNRAQVYYTSPSNLVANATGISNNSSGNGIVLTGVGTSWTSTLPTFTASGVSGASITEQHIVSDTEAVIYLTAGATTGTLTITDPSQGSPNTAQIAVNSGGSGTVFCGQPQAVQGADGSHVKLLLAPAFGDVGPYMYAAYRARNSTFAIGDAGVVSGIAVAKDSATGLIAITDAPPDSKVYTYRVVATSAASVGGTGKSGLSYAGFTPIPTNVTALPGGNSIHIKLAGIGDSIMTDDVTGGGVTETTLANGYMLSPGNANSSAYLNNARGGAQIADFDPALPGGYAGYWTAAKAAILSAGSTVVCCRFGTNDAANGLSASTYLATLGRIAADLATSGIKFRAMYPNWQSSQDGATNDAIISYCDAIDTFTAANTSGNVLPAERRTTAAFVGRLEWFADLLHPNLIGAQKYGAADADAELRYQLSQIPPSPRFRSRAGSRSRTANAQ